ncbi:hypothetical protein J1G42_12875 [Cellulomonas sp. zg-ZUI222]|uniref:hypothetical protein n=1 Tax=Cellulomonas wangleii TaxID=2816956 RepID=UPI001A93B07B|nr:hypothetical protein [Cellulomonas wangleii]MBO0921718.1 hypothetical protein [Cellulomonas wangleii]
MSTSDTIADTPVAGGPATPAPPRRSPAVPRPRALGAGAAVLAALAVGHVVVTAFPVDERVQAPFVRTAAVGETVELRYARVTAGEPTGAVVLDPDDGTLLATPGVWLTVPVTIDALGQPRALGFAELRGGDGRTYTVFTSGRSSFLPGTAQPGIARYATLRVEVAPEAVAGAHLRLGLEQKDQRRDDVADIDLGLTPADADAWAAAEDPVLAGPPSDAPPEEP